jgi:hypothetical protein
VPLTNGLQIKTGSCNGVPMGRILAIDKMPTSKFVFPKNGATIDANKPFTIKMAIKNLKTGNFVNPATNYYSAPAQTTTDGTLIGHSHVVIELMTSKSQTAPTDPRYVYATWISRSRLTFAYLQEIRFLQGTEPAGCERSLVN